MTKTYELWERVERTDDRYGGYRWLVWEVGPIGAEAAHWFETEEEARGFLDRAKVATA